MNVDKEQLKKKNKKLGLKLFFISLLMVGFSFALIPLYTVLCDVFGLNGKTGDITLEQSLTYKADKQRVLNLSFLGTVAPGLPISFKPLTEQLPEINPGEFYTINYEVKNLSDEKVIARAIPSVSPSQASLYFKKLYCFCFSDQVFEPKEVRIMPLRFVIENDLPENLKSIVLSYTFYQSKEKKS